MSKASLKYIKLSLTLPLLASLALFGCSDKPAQTASDAPVVLVRNAEPASAAGTYSTGTVESRERYVISSEASGRAQTVTAYVGDRVTKGQVLAILDPRPTQLQLSQAEAELNRTEALLKERQSALARLKGLVTAGVVSASEYDRTEAEAEAARQSVQSARASFSLAQRSNAEVAIRAPADGVIVNRTLERSQITAAGTPLFELEAGAVRDIRVMVPGDAVKSLTSGQVLNYLYQNQTGHARLLGISSRTSATGAVEARLEILGTAPPAGTALLVHFGAPGASAVTIPATAISTSSNGTQRVFTVDAHNHIQEVSVKLIDLTGPNALISGQIAPGVRVVVAGTDWVKTGMAVRPQNMIR